MPSLAEVFKELNALSADRVIRQYAVAGAMAFVFYTEPTPTYDLDVFVFLPPQDGLILSMEPLYTELRKRGYAFDAEHVMIHGTPVQFLPAYNRLAEEAVEEAVTHDYAGIPVRVVGPEHAIALAIQTGGSRRLVRARGLEEQGTIDMAKLQAILAAHAIQRQ